MTVRFVRDPVFLGHDPGPDHPESPWRYRAILDVRPLPGVEEFDAPRWASLDELALAHDLDWCGWVLSGQTFEVDAETIVGPATAACVARASAAVLDATAHALATRTHAFVAVRPPGHHAMYDEGMGFCLIHHVAVAARRALADGLRVAVVDLDVHWGNGSTLMLASLPGMLVVSLHQQDLFPRGGNRENSPPGVLHLPLPSGTDDAAWLAAFDAEAWPALRAHAPDLVLVSAGYDGHADDPMSGWELTERGYAAMFRRLAALDAPVVAVLEGGYDPDSLRRSVEATLEALCSSPILGPTSTPSPTP